MTTVPVAQHIYTSVEARKSPRNIPGYQTLYCTPRIIDENEDRQIAQHLLFHGPSQKVKRLLFSLPSKKVVLSTVRGLPDLDHSGRTGIYIAHSLIFDSESFIAVGADPFAIFKSFPFVGSISQARELGDPQGGIGVYGCPVCKDTTSQIKAAELWSLKNLNQLAQLALGARELAEMRRSVAILGSHEEIELALKAALLAVPTALRGECSFDTGHENCESILNYFWAVGLQKRPNNRDSIVVDAHDRRLEQHSFEPGNSTYSAYVAFQIRHGKLQYLAKWKDHAFALCRFLDGFSYDYSLIANAPGELIEVLGILRPRHVDDRVFTRIGEFLPAILAQRVFRRLKNNVSLADYFIPLATGKWQEDALLRILAEDYLSALRPAPAVEELAQLGNFALKNAVLCTLYAGWTNRRRLLRSAIPRLNPSEYGMAAKQLLWFGYQPPHRLLAKHFVPQLTEVLHELPRDCPGGELEGEARKQVPVGELLSNGNFLKLIKEIEWADKAEHISGLIPLIGEWLEKEQKELVLKLYRYVCRNKLDEFREGMVARSTPLSSGRWSYMLSKIEAACDELAKLVRYLRS